MVFSVTMLFVMLLTPIASMAWTDTYNFVKSGDVVLYGNGTVTNSSGISVTKISGYDNVAVTGGLGQIDNGMWYCRTNGLYARHGSNETLSILNLQQGQRVTITYNGSMNNQNKPYITFITSGQVEGKNANENVESGATYLSCGGSLDLSVPRYHYISEIKVEDAQWPNYVSFDTSNALGKMKWDATQKKMVEADDGLPYYRVRLSKRDFTEPTVSVEFWGHVGSWTIENYGSDAPANYNPQTGAGNKKVAVNLYTDDDKDENGHARCDVMFINEGWCKVTAYCNGFNASYLVECWDNEANYELQNDGSKYIFVQNDSLAQLGLTGDQGGVLANRVITAIPGIEVKIGIPEMDEGNEPGTDNGNADKQSRSDKSR